MKLLKIGFVVLVVTILLLVQFVFFVQFSPPATTSHYQVNITQPWKPKILRFPDQRTFSYDVSNSHLEDDQVLHTVFLIHGHYGSRLMKHVNETKIIQNMPIRYIRFDRASYGFSSPAPNTSFAQDFKYVLKKLNIDSFSVIGYSLGSSFAVKLAKDEELAKKMQGMSIIAPMFHPFDEKLFQGGCLYNVFSLVRRFGFEVYKFVVKVLSQLGYFTHHSRWYANFESCMTSEDKQMLAVDEWKAIFNDTAIETFRQGTDNIYEDVHHAAVVSVDLEKVRVPVTIYHATNDKLVPIEVAKHAAKTIPQATLKEYANSGHFAIFADAWEDALKSVLPKAVLEESLKEPTFTRHPLVIIGGGLAGLSAAIEAAQAGAQKIVIMDKEPKIGGNSAKASSGISGIFSKAQKAKQIADSVESFVDDTMKSGKGKSDPELVKTLVTESTAAIEFLESNNVNLDILSQCGGHKVPRTHRAKTPENSTRVTNVGTDIITSLENTIKEKYPFIKILTSTKVTQLITLPTLSGGNRVIGVKYLDSNKDEKEQLARGVILTAGGFGADRELLAKYGGPKIASLPTTNGPYSNGEGIKLAENAKLDVATVDMSEIQVHPTCFVNPDDPKAKTLFLAAEALRAHGGILINQKGERFTNELGYRDTVSDDIFKYCKEEVKNGPVVSYMLLNDEAASEFGERLLSFYQAKKFVTKYPHFDGLAKALRIKTDILKKTIESYNNASSSLQDAFNKTTFPTTFAWDKPVYLSRITPCLHYTMGGLKIDTHARVLTTQDKPILGLFAAGEVTGGIHGKNRLAGNSLLECVVFGRIAAKESLK